jgi:GTPase SAR1 family protein
MTERMFKVLVIGDSGVGKTAFVNQYVSGHYKGITKQTFGGREDSTKKFWLFLSTIVARML